MNKDERKAVIGAFKNLDARLTKIEKQSAGGIEIRVDSNNTITIKRLI